MPTLRTSRLLVALRTALPTLALTLPTATAQQARGPAAPRAVPMTPAQPWRAALVPDTAYVDVIALRALGTVTQQAGTWTLRVGSRTIAWTETTTSGAGRSGMAGATRAVRTGNRTLVPVLSLRAVGCQVALTQVAPAQATRVYVICTDGGQRRTADFPLLVVPADRAPTSPRT